MQVEAVYPAAGRSQDPSTGQMALNGHDKSDPEANDEFSNTIERIMANVEAQEEEDGGSSPMGPLAAADLKDLSLLCSTQSSRKRAISDDDLGFADVDPSLTGQLIECLQKQVILASAVDLVSEGHAVIQKIHEREIDISIDQWLDQTGGVKVDKLRYGLEAASVLLFIVNSPGLDRKLISEDAIDSVIALFRHYLAKNVLPAINQVGHMTSADGSRQTRTPTMTSPRKRRRTSGGHAGEVRVLRDMKKVYKTILKTVGLGVLITERLESLVQKIALDDQPLLSISSGALIPLEFDPSAQADIKIANQFHTASVGVITSIFRKYTRHRQIIIEDLFPIMLKLPSFKRSMRTYPIHSSSILFPQGLKTLSNSLTSSSDSNHIQTITALMISLVQCSVAQPQLVHSDEQGTSHQFKSGLTDCKAVSDHFVAQLLQRCAKKGEEGGASEFRPILSNLIDDLLLVLLIPEYPSAEMLLMSIANRISRELVSMCSTTKLTAENTFLSTMLDAFGKVCAAEARILKFQRESPVRLRALTVTPESVEENQNIKNSVACDQCHQRFDAASVGLTKETTIGSWYCDACQLGRIVDFESDKNTNLGEYGCSPALINESYCMRRLLVDYLSIVARKSSLMASKDAYQFHLARWLSELKPSPSDEAGTWPLVTRLMELWDPRESSKLDSNGLNSLNGMLHYISDDGRSRIMAQLACTQSQLLLSYRSQIGLFVGQLMESKGSALLRKLALKAVEKVTDADPQLMVYAVVRKAVTKRFSDEAISVREAAVSLVGLYVVHSPGIANAFHHAFMVGLNDPGVSVRKRTIKILQDILCTNPEYKGRSAACSEMLRLAADPKEDDGVRDAIHHLFLKVWLENGEESISIEPNSPVTPDIEDRLKTPSSKVSNLEYVNVNGEITPAPSGEANDELFTPSPSKRETRSTERRIKRKRLQLRSEIAAEQMIEVVKVSDTGAHLTTLFRGLLSGVSDADKGRTVSSRRKRKVLAEGHCAMLVDAAFEILLRVEESRSSEGGATAQDIVAVMRTIRVFTSISPGDVQKHLDTLLPYFKADNGLPVNEEAIVVASLCDSISAMAPVLTKSDLETLGNTSLVDDLVKITYRFGREALSSAVSALCALVNHPSIDEDSSFSVKLLALAKTFHDYLSKHREQEDLSSLKTKAKANIQRALSVLGAICRYLDFSEHDPSSETYEDHETEPTLTFANLTPIFEDVFKEYLYKNETQAKCAALRGLSGVFIARPREMLRMDQAGLVSEVMASDAPPKLQLESLLCWREILLTEESRVESGEAKAKMDSRSNITVSKRISGDQDADATLFGGVLTGHATRLFEMTQMRDNSIRFAALDLIGHLLRQGQVNPNETVPYLLALQGDVEEDSIRSLALKLLMIEGEKRPDMLRQRVNAGIKQAFAFQRSVYPDKEVVSALVRIRSGSGSTYPECVFARVFKECIAGIRKQRRGLFASLLQRFDFSSRKKSKDGKKNGKDRFEEEISKDDLPLLSFTAQVLAYLPYKVSSDPLYIIYNISAALALRGPDLLDRFATFLRPYGLSSADEMDETNTDEDILETVAKQKIPTRSNDIAEVLESNFDSENFARLCFEATAQTLLLRLKAFLRTAYDLSESRIFGFNPDAKDEREKALSKASQLNFDAALPMLSTKGDNDLGDIDRMIFQYAEFRRLMRIENNLESTVIDDEEGYGNKKRRRSLTDSMEVEP